ncbi:hypothetical protein C8F04DRAFT_1193296 [Mycena alexandri]|uniref:Uncharacterized protein n=1 Tax=Mycena alexandri TaxID=1745969 RepID=A0AAD6S9E5_9AGAR|nr:hypothetical protein C8F04DRAFT_1193296 [Mycena alexandri]
MDNYRSVGSTMDNYVARMETTDHYIIRAKLWQLHLFSHPQSPNLANMQSLRTLELSVRLNWPEIEEVEGHNPLNDAMRSLATALRTVEHLILNLKIWDTDDLEHFVDSPVLNRPLKLLGEGLPALRDFVVRHRVFHTLLLTA